MRLIDADDLAKKFESNSRDMTLARDHISAMVWQDALFALLDAPTIELKKEDNDRVRKIHGR